jgi:hypothetical protein
MDNIACIGSPRHVCCAESTAQAIVFVVLEPCVKCSENIGAQHVPKWLEKQYKMDRGTMIWDEEGPPCGAAGQRT